MPTLTPKKASGQRLLLKGSSVCTRVHVLVSLGWVGGNRWAELVDKPEVLSAERIIGSQVKLTRTWVWGKEKKCLSFPDPFSSTWTLKSEFLEFLGLYPRATSPLVSFSIPTSSISIHMQTMFRSLQPRSLFCAPDTILSVPPDSSTWITFNHLEASRAKQNSASCSPSLTLLLSSLAQQTPWPWTQFPIWDPSSPFLHLFTPNQLPNLSTLRWEV